MQDQEINPETVEEGDVVQYENKYHAAAVVEEITLLRTTDGGLQHYIDWKLKNPGTMTDYVNAGSLEEHREQMINISEKYGNSDD